jgi:peptidoglycan hydrolase CwlO-like protein
MAIPQMAILRRSKAKQASLAQQIAKLQTAFDTCQQQIEHLQHENETHISRMGAMQAEIDHLRAIIGRPA